MIRLPSWVKGQNPAKWLVENEMKNSGHVRFVSVK
jgi:hypothetical protein